MYCNQCGTENAADKKFCVNCGSPLQKGQPQNHIIADKPRILTIGKKTAIVCLCTLILVAIAVFNITNVNIHIVDISTKDNELTANRSDSIFETNSCIYYESGGLYRVNKATNEVYRISNMDISIIAASSNAIYCVDSNGGGCLKLLDSSSELESIGRFINFYGATYIKGKYNYTVASNGAITKRLNSDEYGGYSELLYNGRSSYYLKDSKMYKGYIYMLLTEGDGGPSEFIRVSLSSGKEEQITNFSIDEFQFSGNTIVCLTENNRSFVRMALNGNDFREYANINPVSNRNPNLFCANGFAYYTDGGVIHRFDVDAGIVEELNNVNTSYFTEINGGLALKQGSDLHLYDYNGNEIAVITP